MSHPTSTHALPAGVSNSKLAVWLFLASEVMLFSALFASYIIIRSASPAWEQGWKVLNIPLATLNTFVLITSSVTMVMAFASVQQNNKKGFRTHLSLTLLLSFVFLIIKAVEYSAKFHHGHYPSTNMFYAVYFTMTGLHGLHVIGGIIVNGYLLLRANAEWESPLFAGRVEGAGLYWHFVDVVWIFLFPSLYLL